jgi:Ca-activated chloride channel homolog
VTTRRSLAQWLLCGTGGLLAVSALAQVPTFSVGIETVRVDVLVTEGGEPLLGLGAGDFEVKDNGVVQKLDLATFQQLPLNVVLALDTSGSVSGERLEALQAASRAIVGNLKAGDRAGLLAFSNILSLRTDLTGDVERVHAALEGAPPGGNTSLVDATYAAIIAAESEGGRALVIVLSDGVDTSSFLQPDTVLEVARRSDAVIYGVSVSRRTEKGFIRDVCRATGGRVLRAGSVDRIRETFLDVLEEFRQRYLLRYVPQGVRRAGWHELEVRVKRRHVKVEARPGYVAGP